MTLLLPPRYLGKATIQHPANLDRLGTSGLLQPGLVTTGQTVAVVGGARGGALVGPTGTNGEVTLPNSGIVQVQPGRFMIPGTQDSRQGTYEVTNDDVVNLAVPAQDATLFRRAYVVVYVRDSFVAGGTSDDAVLGIVAGNLAASNPQFPSVPVNSLILGELFVPPTGQTVTLTPYNPRTGLRHGILPVLSTDNANGSYVGQYRDHPTLGLQRWNGSAWKAVYLSPARLETISASALWATPSGGQIATAITVNPATLFGPGIGARVALDGMCLIDIASGAASANWYYNVFRGDGQLLSQDFAFVQRRTVFQASYSVDIPAGSTASYYPSLSAPGEAAGGQTVRTYADFTTNRLVATVFPLV